MSDAIFKAVAQLIQETKAELRDEITDSRNPAQKLYQGVLYRKGLEAQRTIHDFCDGYLHQRAHTVKGTPPSLVTRCMK